MLPNRLHCRFVKLDHIAVWKNVNDLPDTPHTKHRRKHSDAVTISPGTPMGGQRLRFRTHDCRRHVRGYLDNPVYSSRKVFGFRLCLSAGLGKVFVADAVVAEQFGEDESIELRPARAGNASHIAKKPDVVPLQQLEKIRKRMSAMANGIDD